MTTFSSILATARCCIEVLKSCWKHVRKPNMYSGAGWTPEIGRKHVVSSKAVTPADKTQQTLTLLLLFPIKTHHAMIGPIALRSGHPVVKPLFSIREPGCGVKRGARLLQTFRAFLEHSTPVPGVEKAGICCSRSDGFKKCSTSCLEIYGIVRETYRKPVWRHRHVAKVAPSDVLHHVGRR